MAKHPQRKLRNFLLDKSFQLKYAGFLFGVTAVLSLVLGALLWRTSEEMVAQSREAVAQGQQVVELGQTVAAESKKVTSVVEMNIVKDPFYADNPELLATFKEDSQKKDSVLIEQQRALEQQAATLTAQSAKLETQSTTMLLTLFGMLTLLCIGVGLAGIVVTHKVAGPIFKMRRQIHDLADGSWNMPAPLRPGDELAEFFHEFENCVRSLREQRERELSILDALDDQAKLEPLRAEMAKVFADDH
jgi:nitrogen fixation/metabolism regulation signal transduction histidine kinase